MVSNLPWLSFTLNMLGKRGQEPPREQPHGQQGAEPLCSSLAPQLLPSMCFGDRSDNLSKC